MKHRMQCGLKGYKQEEQEQGQEGKLPCKITLGFRKRREEKQEKYCKCEE